MSWSFKDKDPNRPLSEDEQKHLEGLKSWHANYETFYEERERLEKEAEEAAREARENRDRYRIGGPPQPGSGCMLPIMVLSLVLILSMILSLVVAR